MRYMKRVVFFLAMTSIAPPAIHAQKMTPNRPEPLICNERCGEVCHIDQSCFGWSCYYAAGDPLAGIYCNATVTNCTISHECVLILSVYTEGGIWLADHTKCEPEGGGTEYSGGQPPPDVAALHPGLA